MFHNLSDDGDSINYSTVNEATTIINWNYYYLVICDTAYDCHPGSKVL
jgi:hypothetical protein